MKYALALLLALTSPAQADAPVIEIAQARASGDTFGFDVSLRHPDTGWDHYADAWEVLAPDGTSLGIRVLLHPHEAEQPFTRSLNGVKVPINADHVLIRARCLVDGWSEAHFRVDLTR